MIRWRNGRPRRRNQSMPKAIGQNIAWSYANWVASFLTPLVTVPLYVRFLGAKTYGDWIVIISLTSYLGLANLGIGQTVSNGIAEAVATGRDSELGKLVSTAFFVYAALAVLLLSAIYFFTPLFAGRLELRGNTVVLAAFTVYIAMNLASFPMRVNSMVLQGFERVDQDQAIATAVAVARVGLLALVLILGFRLVGVAVVNGTAAIGAAAAAYFWARRLTPHIRPRLSRLSPALLRQMIAPSLAFLGIQVGGSLIFGADNLVIGYALGSRMVTSYAVPFRLVMAARGLFGVAIGALVPTITAAYARREVVGLWRGLSLATRLGLFYGTAATVGLWIAGPSFICAWAGPGIFPGRLTFALQLFLLIASAWVSSASTFLWATTQHYAWSALTVFEGILNLALSLWWVRIWGLPGVIGATVAASMLTNFWYLPYRAIRALEIPLDAALREIGPAFTVAAVAVGAVLVLWRPDAQSWPEVIRTLLAGEAALLVAFGWSAFSRDERSVAIAWLARRMRLERAV
ncbi:MAG: lipopolysaccharide biosynthesis protein [Candidatus Binataceae bacterium]